MIYDKTIALMDKIVYDDLIIWKINEPMHEISKCNMPLDINRHYPDNTLMHKYSHY